MATTEIAKAIKNLASETLKASLKAVQEDASGEKDELQNGYQNAVLNVGVKGFISKLKEDSAKSSLQVLGKANAEGKTLDELKISLGEILLTGSGIHGLIDKAGEALLKQYCETLGLEASDRDDMIKQIADEVMLTGMESFLNKLNLPILKLHCTEMGLTTTGTKKALVEKLMVHIFELEPLEDEKENGKTKPKKDKKKEKTEKSKKRSRSASASKSPKPKKAKTREEKPKKEKKVKAPKEAKKREKFVAPPLDTIRKGKFDTYNDLYDNFNLPDLQGYCKKESIPSSGKKKDIIKRILGYLETGKVEPQIAKKRGKPKKKIAPKTKKQKTSTDKADAKSS